MSIEKRERDRKRGYERKLNCCGVMQIISSWDMDA